MSLKLIRAFPWSLAIVAAIGTGCFAQVGKVLPVDEADQDSSFLAFRSELVEAIEVKDTSFILGILSPKVLNSFGGDGGPEEFRQTWFSGREDKDFWSEMNDVLELDGGFVDQSGRSLFIVPSIGLPRHTRFDAVLHWVIIGDSVPAKAEPDGESKTLAVLSYDIVKIVRPPSDSKIVDSRQPTWVTIVLNDNRSAYVPTDKILNKIGYRAGFVREDGAWKLKFFVTWD